MAGRLRKRWPTRNDLLSWWFFHKLQTAPLHDLDDPDEIKKWIAEFEKLSLIGVHREVYNTYNNFRLEFVNPYYMGFAGNHDEVIKHH